jgi:hypothetical protein
MVSAAGNDAQSEGMTAEKVLDSSRYSAKVKGSYKQVD